MAPTDSGGPRRLLLVVGPATGGVGAHVAGLATALPALGWPVTTFTSPVTAARFPLGDDVVTAWPSGARTVPAGLRELRRRIRGAEVVHAHGQQAGLLSVLIAATIRARQRPAVVISWHNVVLATGWRRRLLALAERLQARRATRITGASADLVDRARALGADSASLAEVAATRAMVSRADETAADALLDSLVPVKRGQSHGPVILTVSRIAPQKSLPVLVEAAARLRGRIPGLRWLVAGDGDPALLASLQQQVTTSGAPVTFLGARSDVPVLMAAADAFALPSAWEARSLAVQEAMAARLPVVATAVGGLPELLGDTGLLVAPGEPVALADALERVLTDRALAKDLSDRARARFDQLPTEKDVVTAWASRYGELLLR
jgi:glycosyltransferase involved in cell wall biosynthesis